MIRCWPIFNAVKHAAKHHRPLRIVRHIRRAAPAVVSKPAIVGWLCITVAGGGWLALPEQPVSAGTSPTHSPSLPTGAGTPMPASDLPREFFSPSILLPPQQSQQFEGGGPLPEVLPETPATTVPEPASILLLATALAFAWRFRA